MVAADPSREQINLSQKKDETKPVAFVNTTCSQLNKQKTSYSDCVNILHIPTRNKISNYYSLSVCITGQNHPYVLGVS